MMQEHAGEIKAGAVGFEEHTHLCGAEKIVGLRKQVCGAAHTLGSGGERAGNHISRAPFDDARQRRMGKGSERTQKGAAHTLCVGLFGVGLWSCDYEQNALLNENI